MAISRQDRAKQFLPFDALKGFQEALRNKETEYEEKKEISEEEQEKISKQLFLIEIGDIIKVKYYYKRQYKEIEGIIKKVDSFKKNIVLIDKKIIKFDDILQIEKI